MLRVALLGMAEKITRGTGLDLMSEAIVTHEKQHMYHGVTADGETSHMTARGIKLATQGYWIEAACALRHPKHGP